MKSKELPREQLDALVALYNKGQFDDVVRQATATVVKYPQAFVIYNILGVAQARLRNTDEAAASFGKAVQIKPDYVEAHNNLGLALQRQGRLEEAIASFSSAIRIKPDYAEAHNNLGAALQSTGRLEDAIASFRRAVQLAPDHAEAHNNLGAALQSQGRSDEAVASFGSAIRSNPHFIEAHSNLCGLYERQNRLGDFERALEHAIRECGKDDANILFRLAQLASRKNEIDDAFGYLKRVDVEKLQLSQRQPYFGLLGKTCDRLGHFGEAFSAFVRQSELAMESPDAKRFNADRLLNPVLSCKAAWIAGAEPAWSRSMGGKAGRSPAFLVGFPRSGTTLLDTFLRGHAQVRVIEEKPMAGVLLKVMSTAFGQRPTIENLNTLSPADILALQDIYFKELAKHVGQVDESKLIIDKFPLNIVRIDIIHRIFPDAKIILALRHPCDCVLSCFMQTFKLNDAMMNFLSLEQSAKLYAAVMELWSAYRQKLDLDVHEVKYEELVQDLEGTCKSMIEFLGLEWDENLQDHQKTALGRDRINTPSYNQVTQPLYKRASGRWINYREQMQPVLPTLQPWIEAFGY